MKNILDDLAKWITAISFALLVATVFHDWGYFSVLGISFQSVQTPYDYLAHGIEWLPFNLMLGGAAAIITFGLRALVRKFIRRPKVQYPSGISQRTSRKENKRNLAVVSLIAVPFAIQAFISTLDQLYFLAAAALTIIFQVIVSIWDDWLPPTGTLKLLQPLPLLLTFAFIVGFDDARRGLTSTASVYRIEPKKGDPFSTNLLRSLDKGLLVWDSAAQRVSLIRWDDVNRISHFTATKEKTTIGCRFTKLTCPEPFTP
jgi:hypothetical protein